MVALVRSPEKARDLSALGIEIYKGDITEKETIRAPMTGVDGVFHVAAWYKIGAKDKHVAETINVGGTRNVLEVMRDLRIPKRVYQHARHLLGYARAAGGRALSFRRQAHQRVRPHQSGGALRCGAADDRRGAAAGDRAAGRGLRPGDASSLGDALRQYLQGKLPLVPQKSAFTWAYIDDVVEGHILAMEKGVPGESYIIAGPPHTLVEVLQTAERITGIPAPRLQAPPAVLSLASGIMGVVEQVVTLPEAYTSEDCAPARA
ncbi:MAG: NAD-dependent epimerase/dehydratase family protein [Anaerolineae bacterium]